MSFLKDNLLVYQLVNKYNFDNIKMHGTNVKKMLPFLSYEKIEFKTSVITFVLLFDVADNCHGRNPV